MKANFGDKVSVATFTQPATTDEPPAEPKPAFDPFEFNLTPRKIKEHLDRFVIRQEDAKKTLSIAVCDHYNHVNLVRRLEKEKPQGGNQIEYSKGNVLLLGPTGVGKTYLVKHIAELIGVPFLRGRLLNRRRPFGWRRDRVRRGIFAGFFLGHGYFAFNT